MNLYINKQKNYLTNLWLATVLGSVGGDKFYQGDKLKGYLKLVSVGGLGIWYLTDIVNYLRLKDEFEGKKINKTDIFNKQTFIITCSVALLIIIVFFGFEYFNGVHLLSNKGGVSISINHGIFSLLLQLYVVLFFYALAFQIAIGTLLFLTFTIVDSLRQKKFGWVFINIFSILIGFIFINAYYYIFVRIHKTKGTF